MRIIQDTVLGATEWVQFRSRRYQDRDGGERDWSFVSRRDARRAVVVVPVTEATGSLVLIRQFRVPLGRDVVEFPAGLIDDGETPEQAAVRELAEETGYQGRIISVGPPQCTSPGLCDELVHLARAVVGEEPAAGQVLDHSERIEVLKVAPGDFTRFLRATEEAGTVCDARVTLYLEGRLATEVFNPPA